MASDQDTENQSPAATERDDDATLVSWWRQFRGLEDARPTMIGKPGEDAVHRAMLGARDAMELHVARTAHGAAAKADALLQWLEIELGGEPGFECIRRTRDILSIYVEASAA